MQSASASAKCKKTSHHRESLKAKIAYFAFFTETYILIYKI